VLAVVAGGPAAAAKASESLRHDPLPYPCDSSTPILVPLLDAFQTVNETEAKILCLADILYSNRDCRSAFLQIYTIVTGNVRRYIDRPGYFRNATWVAQYLISFGNLYREALLNFEQGNMSAVPDCWQTAHTFSRADQGLLLQHIMLGMNAHIVRDLAYAVTEIGITPNEADKLHDHEAVNAILLQSFSEAINMTARMYSPDLKIVASLIGPKALDAIFQFLMSTVRDVSWYEAVQMSKGGNAQSQMQQLIDSASTTIAALTVAEPPPNSALMFLLRALENDKACVAQPL